MKLPLDLHPSQALLLPVALAMAFASSGTALTKALDTIESVPTTDVAAANVPRTVAFGTFSRMSEMLARSGMAENSRYNTIHSGHYDII